MIRWFLVLFALLVSSYARADECDLSRGLIVPIGVDGEVAIVARPADQGSYVGFSGYTLHCAAGCLAFRQRDSSPILSKGDLSDDGVVDLYDFNVLKADFGNAQPLPEPSGWALISVASLCLVFARPSFAAFSHIDGSP